MDRRRCVAVAAMALVAPSFLTGDTVEVYRKTYDRFAGAMTQWMRRAAAISPYSLNFREVVAGAWYEFRVGELFRELEQAVTDWR